MNSDSVRPELVEGRVNAQEGFDKLSPNGDVLRAVSLLLAGDLVGIPTETVYGLAADAANPQAVAKIFKAKGRPADHPLIVHVAGAEELPRWAKDIPVAAYQLAAAFWPGPMTLGLLRAFAAAGGSGGVAAPSANRFGRISPTTAEHVREELGESVALVLDGGSCEVGIESTIIDLSRGEPVILRPGAITAEDIERVLHQGVTAEQKKSGTPRVSGSLEAHYAPRTPMRLVAADALQAEVNQLLDRGQTCAVLSFQPLAPSHGLTHYPASHTAAGYAHDIYAALRTLDASGADIILVEALPQGPVWDAVADRLGRAAVGAGR